MKSTWEISFAKPAEAWSLNRQLHWSKKSKLTSLWRAAAAKAAAAQIEDELPLPPCIVDLAIPFEKKAARRDPHNFVGVLKAVVDGLGPPFPHRDKATGIIVNSPGASVWPDDTPEFVRTMEPMLVQRKDGLVVVTLTER